MSGFVTGGAHHCGDVRPTRESHVTGYLFWSFDEVRRTVERLRAGRRRRTMVVVRLLSLLAAGCLALAAVSGCTARRNDAGNPAPTRTSASAFPTGTLTGTLAVYGGAETSRSCGCHLEEGTVVLHRGSDAPVMLHVGKSGRFSAQIPPGRYSVEAGTRGQTHWPMGSCGLLQTADEPGATQTSRQRLTVRQSRTTHVAIGCLGL